MEGSQMLQFEISANLRETFGKGAARKMRRDGKTPGVVYGPSMEPLSLELDTKTVTKLLLSIQRRNAVLNLEIKGLKKKNRKQVIVKEIQSDPVTDGLAHADFYEISMDKPFTLQVPLVYKGKAKGVDMGGDLVISKSSVTLKGKILDIPDTIEVDVTDLEPGAGVSCQDLTIPANISLLDKQDSVCVAVTPVNV
jgi:large subunit ribosomal protein L25